MTRDELLTLLRDAWHRLGTPDAINWASLWFAAFLFVSGALGANALITQGRELTLAVISLASVVAMGMSLWMLRWMLARIPRPPLRPWATLVAFELVNVVRAWVFDELFVMTGFGDEHRLAYRILTGQITGVLGLLLAGLLVPYARAFSRTNSELNDAVRALSQSQRDAQLQFEELRVSLTSHVRQRLTESLEPLTGRVAETDARTLRHAIDDVIRPLSHQLAWETRAPDYGTLSTLTRTISWREIFSATLRTNPIRPIPTLVWIAIIVTQVSLIFRLSNAWLGITVSLLLSALLLYSVRWIWSRAGRARSLTVRTSSLALVYLALGVMSGLTVQFMLDFGLFDSGIWVWACVQSIVIGWAISLIAGARDLFHNTNHELASALDNLRHHIASTNGAAVQLQKDVSRVVHGPIQDAIALALRKVDSLAPGEQLSPEYVVAVRDQIDVALSTLSRESARITSRKLQTVRLSAMLADLRTLWSDSLEFTFDLSPADESRIDADATATDILFEIVRESCSNAIRHGDARHATAIITCDIAQRTARVVVSNDGAALPKNPVQGLGSRTMSDLTIAWSRTQVGDYVVVEADIPVHLA